jgi:hypothetical protein
MALTRRLAASIIFSSRARSETTVRKRDESASKVENRP